jgi:Ca-activated chloride channel homolog
MLRPSCAYKSYSFKARTLRLFLLKIGMILAVIVLPSTPPCHAQEAVQDDDVVRVNTDLLLFPVRIRDRRGMAVPGLTDQDLVLKDPDKATAGLYFSPGADQVALMFALDQSGSLREIIAQQREAALALFSQFGERSSVAVLRFTQAASLSVPFTRDQATALAAFKFNAAPNQHTAIFDAANEALKVFAQRPMLRSERRIVVLISDGLDNASTTKAQQVIAAAQSKRISFYVIHLPLFEPRDGQLKVRTPSKGFRELAEKTGGKYFLVGDSRSALSRTPVDLKPIFSAIEEDLKSQYLLGFYIAESAKDNRKHVFSLSLKKEGTEYSFGQMGYSRSHKFFINLPPGAMKLPQSR